ncbi:hypothetical protein [Trinickia diaoshuihuensis]|uniref:hypothetical protein n=1 Tax=Trinickia diaoshuihuensis TaxID=2292265 RepID=UPI0013C36CA3|nr:hypothetical protein [Trinickia diaoshuihuensis]
MQATTSIWPAMLSSQQTSDLIFLYDVEVEGEAFFDTMLRQAADVSDQRYKLALMLQLETETRARIRCCLTKHGIFRQGDDAASFRGRTKASELAGTAWADFIRALQREAVAYAEICAATASRGPASAMSTLSAVVAHEHAFVNFCALELLDDRTSTAPLIACLQFSPRD